MKKCICFAITLIMLCMGSIASAQNAVDVVSLKNGSVIKGTIVEMQLDSIVKIQTSDGSLFVYKVGEVEKITKEVQVSTATTHSNGGFNGSMDGGLCYQAEEDCKLHYDGKGAHVGGIVLTSLILSPLVGLIPAATAANDQPNIEGLRCPNPDLYKTNTEYKRCYDSQAKRMRSKKAWTTWGVSLAANICLWAILYSALGN